MFKADKRRNCDYIIESIVRFSEQGLNNYATVEFSTCHRTEDFRFSTRLSTEEVKFSTSQPMGEGPALHGGGASKWDMKAAAQRSGGGGYSER